VPEGMSFNPKVGILIGLAMFSTDGEAVTRPFQSQSRDSDWFSLPCLWDNGIPLKVSIPKSGF